MTVAQLLKKYDAIQASVIKTQVLSMNKAFIELSNEVAPLLKSWKKPKRKNTSVWTNNKRVQQQLEAALERFRGKIKAYIDIETEKAYELANTKNDLLVKAYMNQLALADIVRDEKMFLRNHEAMRAFQQRVVDGLDLSKRIWNNTKDVRIQIEMFLESGLATGRSANKLASDINGYLVNPDKRFRRIKDLETGKLLLSEPAKGYKPGKGRYRSSFQNALRLTATETNMAYRLADYNRWNQIEFVQGIKISLSSRHPRPDICDHMVGYYPKSFLFTGWHPRCFCFTVPVLMKADDFAEFLVNGKRNAPPVNTIPIKAKKYIEDHTKAFKGYKNTPYFLKDNFKLSNGNYVPKTKIMKKEAYEKL